jgi:hypothetical protein
VDTSSIRGFLSAFGIAVTDVTVNPFVIAAMVVGTYMLRRIAAAAFLPTRLWRLEAWLDWLLCWFGNPAWAVFVVAQFEPPMPWKRLLIYALVLDAFAVWLYERFGKQVLEFIGGPIPGPAPPPAGQP